MFRDMRRKHQLLSEEESLAVLQKGSSGVLALLGDEGYPYALPISYTLVGESLYFHSATEGHKIDAIKKEPKASFCVIDMDVILPEQFTTCYRSVIAFGTMSIVEEPEELQTALMELAKKYSSSHIEHAGAEIARFEKHVSILRLDIEHLTGKQAKELLK